MVVPVQPAEGGQRGYVTVPVYFKAFDQPLAVRIDNPDAGVAGAKVLLVSRDKKVIASHGDGLERGRDASSLAVMARAPDRMSRVDGHRFEVQTELSLDGVPSVATIATIPGVDWGLALWRPQSVAYARYEDVQRLAYGLGAVAVALALLAAFASARSIAAPVLRLVDKAKVIASRRWSEVPAPEARGDEIGELSQAMSDMAKDLETSEEEIRRQTKLRADLGRFVSADLVDAMVRGEHDLRLGGERRPISVLFADVVAFTPMAEQLPPETVVKLLNELFSVLTELVFQHEGMVDKFVGDCVRAVWGAPVPGEDHARRALACAEDMMSFLEAGRDQWRDRYGVELRLAIGVNSGEAIVGNIGPDKRMEYTVGGDVVNVAARLESLAAPNQVLVAEGARALVGDEFELRRLGKKRLTGREKETEVYELTS